MAEPRPARRGRTGGWSVPELDTLRRLFPARPAEEVARALSRSVASVRRQARQMFGGRRRRGTWSDEDDEQLRRSYGAIPDADLAMVLGRTTAQVRRRARELRERPRAGGWTRGDVRLLKKVFGSRSEASLEVCLQRSAADIEAAAGRLGLARSKVHVARDGGQTRMPRWRREELRLLARLYPDLDNLEIARRLGRSVASVNNKARRLGLRKSPSHRSDAARANVGSRADRGGPGR